MKLVGRTITAIVVAFFGIGIASGEEKSQRTILEFTFTDPLEKSFAIETIVPKQDGGPIRIRQFRPIVEELDLENPSLEMFALEITETWKSDVRIIVHEDDGRELPHPLKAGDRRKLEARLAKLFDRGNVRQQRGKTRYFAETKQG